MELEDGSRVGVIGAGPAGSFAAYFLLQMARQVGQGLEVDIYDFKDFSEAGPKGCNNCGGIISESLVQILATEGVILPPSVVQRGIDSYVLHTEVGKVRIETPTHEMRIAAVHRGAGPRGSEGLRCDSLDAYLLALAREKGARFVRGRVEEVSWDDGRPRVRLKGGAAVTYDLLVCAVGINTASLKLFEGLDISYRPPRITKTFICEYRLGRERVSRHLGNAMHVFLLDIPHLEFAALIPKGEHVTLCLLGEGLDKRLLERFLAEPAVRACFPPDMDLSGPACQCGPRLQMRGAGHPYGDRIVFVGDSGVSRLYKDGIGAAYRTGKAAALAAFFEGVSGEAFERRYLPACRSIATDNAFGKALFTSSVLFRKLRFLQRGMVRMVEREQGLSRGEDRVLSGVLWDTFTGSAPYRDIFRRALRPGLLLGLAGNVLLSIFPSRTERGSSAEETLE